VESVSPSGIEAVVADACWHELVNTNVCRALAVSCCCVLRFRMSDVQGAGAGGYK